MILEHILWGSPEERVHELESFRGCDSYYYVPT